MSALLTLVELEREWTCSNCWEGEQALSRSCSCTQGPCAFDVSGNVWMDADGSAHVVVDEVRDEVRHRRWRFVDISSEFSDRDRDRFQEALWDEFLSREAKHNQGEHRHG